MPRRPAPAGFVVGFAAGCSRAPCPVDDAAASLAAGEHRIELYMLQSLSVPISEISNSGYRPCIDEVAGRLASKSIISRLSISPSILRIAFLTPKSGSSRQSIRASKYRGPSNFDVFLSSRYPTTAFPHDSSCAFTERRPSTSSPDAFTSRRRDAPSAPPAAQPTPTAAAMGPPVKREHRSRSSRATAARLPRREEMRRGNSRAVAVLLLPPHLQFFVFLVELTAEASRISRWYSTVLCWGTAMSE
ncbi:hypothetical protein ABZP36_000028 [Zizania latifolia]